MFTADLELRASYFKIIKFTSCTKYTSLNLYSKTHTSKLILIDKVFNFFFIVDYISISCKEKGIITSVLLIFVLILYRPHNTSSILLNIYSVPLSNQVFVIDCFLHRISLTYLCIISLSYFSIVG